MLEVEPTDQRGTTSTANGSVQNGADLENILVIIISITKTLDRTTHTIKHEQKLYAVLLLLSSSNSFNVPWIMLIISPTMSTDGVGKYMSKVK